MVMRIPLPKAPPGSVVEGIASGNALTREAIENRIKSIEAQYKPQLNEASIAHTLAQVPYLQAQTQLLNEQIPLYKSKTESDIAYQNALSKQAQQNAIKNAFLLQHPGLMGGQESKTLEALKIMGYIKDDDKQNLNNMNNVIPSNETTTNNNQTYDESRPFNTGNPVVDTILNQKYARSHYYNLMGKGYNWSHMPAEARNQLVAQGYAMKIDPMTMQNLVNQGLTMADIARKYKLDPDNLPSPIYPPTTATKTRVQQVQQVTSELDYLSSATTPIIKQYAGTIMNYSPEKIKDMLSGDVEAQKRYGAYVGALSLQSGLANGRVLAEGGRSGLETMRMVKDSALAGIDQHSPVKMSKVAYQEAQDTIDRILQRGAKIRTTTGMHPLSGTIESPYSVKEKMIKVRNKKTGETKKISESQARKMGLIK